MERSRGSEEGVGDSMRSLFLGNSKSGKVEKCEVCFAGGGQLIAPLRESLSEEVVGLVLKSLLVPKEERGIERRALWLCGACTATLTSLTHLFLQLEGLRWEFNDLRRKVGRQVILGSLGESEEVWEEWEREVAGIEDVFPSCVGGRRKEVRDVGVTTEEMEIGVEGIEKREGERADECDVTLESVEGSSIEDLKLNKMTAVVLLERLKETCSSELTEKFWFEEEESKSEIVKFLETTGSGSAIMESQCLNSTDNEKGKNGTLIELESGRLWDDLKDIKSEEYGKTDEEDFDVIYRSPNSTPRKRRSFNEWKQRSSDPNRTQKRTYVKAEINTNGVRHYRCECGLLHKNRQSRLRCMNKHIHYPFSQCDKCLSTFSRRDNLYTHYRKIHRINFLTGKPAEGPGSKKSRKMQKVCTN